MLYEYVRQVLPNGGIVMEKLIPYLFFGNNSLVTMSYHTIITEEKQRSAAR